MRKSRVSFIYQLRGIPKRISGSRRGQVGVMETDELWTLLQDLFGCKAVSRLDTSP